MPPVVETKVHATLRSSDMEPVENYDRQWGNMARRIPYQMGNPYTKQF